MRLRSAKGTSPKVTTPKSNEKKAKVTKKAKEPEQDVEDEKEDGDELFFISAEPDKDDEKQSDHEDEEEQDHEEEEEEEEEENAGFVISAEPDIDDKTNENSKKEDADQSKDDQKTYSDTDSEDEDVKEEDEDTEWSMPLGQTEEDADAKSKRNAERERMLQRMLFGSDALNDQQGVGVVGDDDGEEEVKDEEQGDDDKKGSDKEDDKDGDFPEKRKKKKKDKSARKPAWVDEDDENVLVKDVTATYTKAVGKHGLKETSTESYSKSLKRKYVSIVGTPAWADLDRSKKSKGDEDSDEEFFRETTDMLDIDKHSELTKGRLDYRKVRDLNDETHAEGTVIRAAEFHPSVAMSLVAGLNGTASLFQVDGRRNPKIQSVNFKDFPIKTAHFSHDGGQFICGSQKAPYFHVFDLNKSRSFKVDVGRQLEQGCLQWFEVSPFGDYLAVLGRFGHIHMLSAKTKEKIFSLKMNDDVTCVAFSNNGTELYSHGAGGEVYLWDVRQTRTCSHRFVDDGCVRGMALAVSSDRRYLATGADSGVVNLYATREALESTHPKPLKTSMNLVTPVSKLKFNPTSEILAMTSELKDNAIKLMHVPSRSVFENFPSWNFNLRRVNCLDFSLNGGFMSVGNNRGAANLYRLNHFGNY